MIDKTNQAATSCICRITGAVIETEEAEKQNVLWRSFELDLPDTTNFIDGSYNSDVIPKDVPSRRLMYINTTCFEKNLMAKTYKIGKRLLTDQDVVEFFEMLEAMKRDFLHRYNSRRNRVKSVKRPISLTGIKSTFPEPSAKQIPLNENTSLTEDTLGSEDESNERSPASDTCDKSQVSVQAEKPQNVNAESHREFSFPMIRATKNPNWADLSWAKTAFLCIQRAREEVELEFSERKMAQYNIGFSSHQFLTREERKSGLAAIVAHQNHLTPFFIVANVPSTEFLKMKPSAAVIYDPALVMEYIDEVRVMSNKSLDPSRHLRCDRLDYAYRGAERILSGEDIRKVELAMTEHEQVFCRKRHSKS